MFGSQNKNSRVGSEWAATILLPPSQGSCVQNMHIVETRKNAVVLDSARVTKTFKQSGKARRHFRCEIHSLRRLSGLAGIPQLLGSDEANLSIIMSRLPGMPMTGPGAVSVSSIRRLRALVEEVLERGVARHSMPKRDVLLDDDGQIGLVDFERVTLRHWRYSPIWLAACMVSRFHLLRLVGEYAPQLLSPAEARKLRIQGHINALYRRVILFRRAMGARP